ncbi:MAG: hypothetical protein IM473_18815 [Microcystis sp. M015S2]|uniref:hypothetical protein n=1 Tax=unclassified Microcystis TaxID=2643300 RepID=UPI002588BB7E|nr:MULTISPECIES: hypothetical protein [unclassified Microcystis]MCA2711177.1 hypothetical protein [Microcystis sp. M025S2]MCA2744386.1 hypothetical protein [Microcystis sp. M015S2]MCA2757528.1 hypothetical protein [Microcystis sp. M145S2]
MGRIDEINLFKESDRKLPCQQEKLVVDKENLLLWKHHIFEYQQSTREQKQLQQRALFDLPRQTWHTPNEIDPFVLILTGTIN